MNHVYSLPSLPKRAEESHKGTFGTALLIGGSRGMTGSIALAGLGALRAGCGLVFLGCPASCQNIVAGFEPSYLTIDLAEDDSGQLLFDSVHAIRKKLESTDAAAVGPGLGKSRELELLLRDLYASVSQPLVLDADALNNLANLDEPLPDAKGPRIVTPHPGEMGRLLKISAGEVQADREEQAAAFARDSKSIVVLKGHQTIVTDGDRVAVNQTGNSGLATGGTGDVLTGMITSLLAQGMSPFEAAQLGTHLHGLAGDLAAEQLGTRAMIASDLPTFIPQAIRDLTA